MADQSKLDTLVKQVEALIEQCVEEANQTGKDFRISLVGSRSDEYDIYNSVFAVEYQPYNYEGGWQPSDSCSDDWQNSGCAESVPTWSAICYHD